MPKTKTPPITITTLASELGVHRETIKYNLYIARKLGHLGHLVGRRLEFTPAEAEKIRRFFAVPIQSGRKPAEGRAGSPHLVERLAQARALQAEKVPLSEIAKRLGYSDATAVSRLLRRGREKDEAGNA